MKLAAASSNANTVAKEPDPDIVETRRMVKAN